MICLVLFKHFVTLKVLVHKWLQVRAISQNYVRFDDNNTFFAVILNIMIKIVLVYDYYIAYVIKEPNLFLKAWNCPEK